MRALLVAVLALAACGGARRDPALAHATTVLARQAALAPDPRVSSMLADARGRAIDDPQVRDDVIRFAARLERELELVRRGTVRERD